VFAPRLTRLVAGAFTALTGADFLHLASAAAQKLYWRPLRQLTDWLPHASQRDCAQLEPGCHGPWFNEVGHALLVPPHRLTSPAWTTASTATRYSGTGVG